MIYWLGQKILEVMDSRNEYTAYQQATIIVNTDAKIKEISNYKKQVTVADFIRNEKMKSKKQRIQESIAIVSVHFKVDANEKYISIPENVSLHQKPQRTREHISRLKKHNFHIQSSIA